MVIDMDHDVFRYLFKGKGYPSNLAGSIMLQKEHFSRMPLPDSWNYCLDAVGEGDEVDFPIRAKALVRKSSLKYVLNKNRVLAKCPLYVIEVVNFYILRKPCSVDCL